jgi:hypothetical protein
MASRKGIQILEGLGYVGAVLIALSAALSVKAFQYTHKILPYLLVGGLALSLVAIVRMVAVVGYALAEEGEEKAAPAPSEQPADKEGREEVTR